eukprot:4558233-Amphidinium_carterae.1
MAVWVAVNLNILQSDLQICLTTPLLPERINVVLSSTCQPLHNKAWLDRLWRTSVARTVFLPSTKGVYSWSTRAVLDAPLNLQVSGTSP